MRTGPSATRSAPVTACLMLNRLLDPSSMSLRELSQRVPGWVRGALRPASAQGYVVGEPAVEGAAAPPCRYALWSRGSCS